MDDLTFTTNPGVGNVTTLRFAVANLNAIPHSVRARLRFWNADGTPLGGVLPNGPGTYYAPGGTAVGYSFNAFTFGVGVTTLTGNLAAPGFAVPAGATTTLWAGITFDSVGTTTGANDADLSNFGMGFFTPVDLGSSTDTLFQTTAAGSFFNVANPAGAGVNFGGSPVATQGWEFVVATLGTSADLSIAKSDSIDPVTVGGALAYTLAVNNAGPDAATSVSVVDTLPAGVAFVSASGTGWTCGEALGVVTCTLPSLAAGPAAAITVNVTAPATAGSMTNNVTVSATEADPNGGNNSDSEDTGVVAPPNIGATKSVAGSFLPGGAIIYTVVITNSGVGASGDNPGDEFTDVLPAGLTLVGASATSGMAVATIGTNTVTWNGALAASGSVTINIDANISLAAPPGSTISNQGTVSFDADGDGSNESSVSTDDPAVAGGANPTSFAVALGVQTAVPLFGLGGLLLLGGSLLMLALVVLRRRTA